jgi:RNA recognition motif-containing protein
MALVVRHTFWELEESEGVRGRPRAFTDSCIGDSTCFGESTGCDSSTLDTCSTSDSAHEGSWSSESSCWSDEDSTPNATSRTTIVIRGLAGTISQVVFLQVMDSEGLSGHYDFVYLPTDFKRNVRFGYAIVNFASGRAARAAYTLLEGHHGWTVEWSESHQGLDALIQRYRNSTVMHESVADVHKPLIFSDGVRATFPAPTEVLTVPPFQNKKRASTKKNQNTRKQVTCKPAENRFTTIVLRQLPKHTTRCALMQALRGEGFDGLYDFLYLPIDFIKNVCYGFAIINFVDPRTAEMAMGRLASSVSMSDQMAVEWSDSHQGLDALIERYRNSKVMDSNVTDSHKPILLKNGCVLPFPEPNNQ